MTKAAAAAEQKVINVLSLGAGVQSTTLLLMACKGEITPKPDLVIFSDTGWEISSVYKHFQWLKEETAKHGIEIITTQNGSLRQDIEDFFNDKTTRMATPPFFIKNEEQKTAMIHRQCTVDYKVVPVRREIKKQLGYTGRQKVREKIILWLGISTDEIFRAKDSRRQWIEHRFPLIEINMSRANCLQWLEKNGYPQAPKSSCIGCPYHDNGKWLEIKRNYPEDWADAVKVDELIRNHSKFKGELFLHRSGVPLAEVDLQEDQMEIDNFMNECDGMCGL